MHRLFSEKTTRWLLPAVLVLIILQALTLPMVLGLTYAGRSEAPNHILTYTQGKLTWDSATGIDENGVAELDLFDAQYDNVASEAGKNIVAPGTEGFSIVRLKNCAIGAVDYTAVLYRICTDETLPVEASLTGSFADTTNYTLPEGVSEDQVIRAVGGKIRAEEILDFDISWLWAFYESDQQDIIDTRLGAKEESDTVTVGLYIYVEDNNSYVSPDVPQTGDNSHIGIYTALMVASFIVLILLLLERRKEKTCVY